MNFRKSFLIPLAVAIASLSSTSQAVQNPKVDQGRGLLDPSKSSTQDLNSLPLGQEKELMVSDSDGDIFKFVLKRSESGILMASHRSHQSHRSHSSHRSHYSSSD